MLSLVVGGLLKQATMLPVLASICDKLLDPPDIESAERAANEKSRHVFSVFTARRQAKKWGYLTKKSAIPKGSYGPASALIAWLRLTSGDEVDA